MRRVVLAFLTIAGWGQPLDPLTVDLKHYRLEIENQWVRVFRELMTPRDTMPMHQHPLPGSVVVLLTDRHNRLTSPEGAVQEFRNKAGEFLWAAASAHRSENLTGDPFEALQIEPRRPQGVAITPVPKEPMDPALIDPEHYRVQLENEYVRVLRVTIAPHETLKLHQHPATKAVLVHLTDQNMRLHRPDGTTSDSKYPAKQVRWVESAGAHRDENLSDAPLEFLRIELNLAR